MVNEFSQDVTDTDTPPLADLDPAATPPVVGGDVATNAEPTDGIGDRPTAAGMDEGTQPVDSSKPLT